MDTEALLECALDVGEQMLICGAEISRVEDTVERICYAYGASRVDVFTITSCIIATVKFEGANPATQTRRIRVTNNDLTKLDHLNALSRRICQEKPDFDEFKRAFHSVISPHLYPLLGQYANFALVSSSFSVFFGGSWQDALVSGAIGIILKWLTMQCARYGLNNVLSNVFCSFVGGYIAVLALRMGLGDSFDKIAIGVIMLLIPGILLTNSLRDMIGGDTVSGIMRLCNALLGSVAIAIGFALAGGMI